MNTDGVNAITERIIGCVYAVSNALGCGFLEKVYENALAHELRKAQLEIEIQKRLTIYYDGVIVGDYVADLVVEGVVLVEIKAVKVTDPIHIAQCINYLKATRLPICLLVNFGTPKATLKRIAN